MPKLKLQKLTTGNLEKEREFTVSDIPEEDLEKVLTDPTIGFPAGHAKNMQHGWPKGTKLSRKALQDFAAGAANESAQQK